MNETPYPRWIELESVLNFRDLGGYRTRDGATVAWRKLYRCGELSGMTDEDHEKLVREHDIRISSVLDLRSRYESGQYSLGPLARSAANYINIPLMTDGGDPNGNEDRYEDINSMGEFYRRVAVRRSFGEGIVKALEQIADAENHPVLFHCFAGKDRTGMLAGVLLSLLGVPEEDIVAEYALSDGPMLALLEHIRQNPEVNSGGPELASFFWRALPESMTEVLEFFRQEYGSTEGYVKAYGAEDNLVSRLREALLD